MTRQAIAMRYFWNRADRNMTEMIRPQPGYDPCTVAHNCRGKRLVSVLRSIVVSRRESMLPMAVDIHSESICSASVQKVKGPRSSGRDPFALQSE
jgi:hypothetical protein